MDGGKKVMRLREVLKRAAGELRRLDATEPPARRRNLGGKKAGTWEARTLERTRASETNWWGRAEGSIGKLRRAGDKIAAMRWERDRVGGFVAWVRRGREAMNSDLYRLRE